MNLLKYDLAGAANELLANFAVVGEQCFVALDAVRLLVLQDVLLSIKRLFALCTVVALGHRDPKSCKKKNTA